MLAFSIFLHKKLKLNPFCGGQAKEFAHGVALFLGQFRSLRNQPRLGMTTQSLSYLLSLYYKWLQKRIKKQKGNHEGKKENLTVQI